MIGRALSHFSYSNIAHQKMMKRIPKYLIRASYFVLGGTYPALCISCVAQKE